MTLHRRTALIIGVTMTCLLALLIIMVDVILLNGITRFNQHVYWVLVVSALALAIVALVNIERTVLARLARLEATVKIISTSGDDALRVVVDGRDELASLGRTINQMLDIMAHFTRELEELTQELDHRVEQRTAELDREHTRLRMLINSLGEAVIFEHQGQIEYVNDALLKLTAYRHHELTGHPRTHILDTLRHGEPQHTTLGQNNLPVVMQRGDSILHCKSGEPLTVAAVATTVVEVDGTSSTVYIVRDVSEERALQTRRDEFLAHASHELRTPITNLMTRLYLLHHSTDPLETHLAVLDVVAKQMRDLVEDLLDISRFKKGTIPLRKERLHLQAVIDQVIAIQQPEADKKHIDLASNQPPAPIYIYADAKRITQVVTNLVINAINYTAEGGCVGVRLESEQDRICMTVQDSGVGIDAAHLPHIFDPFYRVSDNGSKGTGLGLAIVKEIVDRHGGHISAESEIGKGTRFIVRLVALKDEARS